MHTTRVTEMQRHVRRLPLLLVAALVASCSPKPQRGTSLPAGGQGAVAAAGSVTIAGLRVVAEVHPGDIENKLLGIEDEPPTKATRNDVEVGPLEKSLSVVLTSDSPVTEGVRIEARGGTRTYSLKVDDVRSIQSNEGQTEGYYFSVQFENKPWSPTEDWTIGVYCGAKSVLEKRVKASRMPLIIYDRPSDNPFDTIDLRELKRGVRYRLSWQNTGDLLVVYYSRAYDVYRPILVGVSRTALPDSEGLALTIEANAPAGQYYFAAMPRGAIDGKPARMAVFGYREVQ